jgi:hypothetical protein
MATSAVPAQPGKRHRNQGVRWTAEHDEELVARFRAGAGQKELMEEFGRSRGGIVARLEHLGLITPAGGGSPAAAAPGESPVPRTPDGRAGAETEVSSAAA